MKTPDWLAPTIAPLAPDFGERTVNRPREGDWHPTGLPGLEVRPFECLYRDRALRFSGQLRTAPDADPVELGALRGGELLVQRAHLALDARRLGPGTYLRLPRGARVPVLEAGALVYLSMGQMAPTDHERRIMDTTDADAWLEGPLDGIEVLPLHGHRTGNAVLVRWSGSGAFRTTLDPIGEELLVLDGTLHDADGSYPAGTWIRNPVPAWQAWAGSPGTLVCYKSGHFGGGDPSDDAT